MSAANDEEPNRVYGRHALIVGGKDVTHFRSLSDDGCGEYSLIRAKGDDSDASR